MALKNRPSAVFRNSVNAVDFPCSRQATVNERAKRGQQEGDGGDVGDDAKVKEECRGTFSVYGTRRGEDQSGKEGQTTRHYCLGPRIQLICGTTTAIYWRFGSP